MHKGNFTAPQGVLQGMKNNNLSFINRALLLAAVPLLLVGCGPAVAEKIEVKPVATAAAGQETATFAAGCFWSMEAIFEDLKGVSSVEPGYAGGKVEKPDLRAGLQ